MADMKLYWQELAKKAGLPEEKAKAVLEALGDEAVAKAFNEGFKALPDYSRDLDRVRDETKASTAATVKGEYDKWYQETALPAYQANLQGVETLKKYQATYGPLDDAAANAASNGNRPNPDVLTKKEFEEALRSRDQMYVNLTKTATRIATDYYHRFKEPLDVDAVEKLAVEKQLPDRKSVV